MSINISICVSGNRAVNLSLEEARRMWYLLDKMFGDVNSSVPHVSPAPTHYRRYVPQPSSGTTSDCGGYCLEQ